MDRIRRRTAVLAGLQIWSIVCTLTALSRNFTGLLIFRTAEGLGETVYFPASHVDGRRLSRARKPARVPWRFIKQASTSWTIAGGFFAGLIQPVLRAGDYVVRGFRLAFGIVLGIVLRGSFLKEPRRGASESLTGPEDGREKFEPPRCVMDAFRNTTGHAFDGSVSLR